MVPPYASSGDYVYILFPNPGSRSDDTGPDTVGYRMAGETDLDTILASLTPKLSTEEFVFCTFAEGRYGDHAILDPIACVTEHEGLTLVLPRDQADLSGLPYETVFRRITLQVHSSLDAVGLTAAVATRLAEHGMSANVVAGYYHDHIFVPTDLAQAAVDALLQLAS